MAEYEAICIDVADVAPPDPPSIVSIGLEGAFGETFTFSTERVYTELAEGTVTVTFSVEGTTYELEPVPEFEGIRTAEHDRDADPLLRLPHC